MADGGVLFPLLAIERLRMETDGAGVTALVAGAGCPLKCRWCINKRLLAEKKPEYVTAEELFRRTRIDNLYFQATGGGICFGGGEALLHAQFISAFREYCGSAWRLTAETSLNVPTENVQIAAACVDDFIVDVKTADAEIYRRYSGDDNAPVLRNLKMLIGAVGPDRVKVRVPLIPGYNDEADRAKTVALLENLGCAHFDLFAYRINNGAVEE